MIMAMYNTISNNEIQTNGLNTLKEVLGVVSILKLI